MPISGPHNLNMGERRNASAATMTSVTNAVNEPPTGSAAVASSNNLKTTDAKVMDRIIITVPPTIGVTIRLSKNNHFETASWITAEMITSVVNVAGPPSTTAVIQNGIANAAVNIGRTTPPPIGPTRRAWIRVEIPTTTNDAKTIQLMYQSPRPDAWATITGVTNNVAEAKRLNCKPSPAVVGIGGFSSTSNRGFCVAVAVGRFSRLNTTNLTNSHLTRCQHFNCVTCRLSLDRATAISASANGSNITISVMPPGGNLS